MIIEPKKTTLAYRCPDCGGVTTSVVGIFSLSADLFKLKCSCGNSFMTIQKTNNDSYRLTVPCVSCPHPHDYVLSSNVFFNTEAFMLPCSFCGIDICFIGTEEKVSQLVEKSNEEIAKLLGEYTLDQIKSKENDLNNTSPEIIDTIRFVIADLIDDNKIYCNCDNNDGDIVIDVMKDFVSVNCKKCAAKKIIPTDSMLVAQDMLKIDELILK